MGIETGMFRLGAVLPGIVLSAALTLVVSATLPPTLGGMLLVAYVVAAVLLAFGQLRGSGGSGARPRAAGDGGRGAAAPGARRAAASAPGTGS